MSSILKVDQLQDSGGNNLVTSNGSAGNMNQMRTWIYKNGSAYRVSATNFDTDNAFT